MNISVDISYYPLKHDFIAPILDFIERLNKHKEIKVVTNGISTQVFGEYFELMKIITDEIFQSFSLPYSVFVLKVINADLQDYETENKKGKI
ncbi:hypothetical protein ACFLRZ_04770 [Bacteroidota bacterium]